MDAGSSAGSEARFAAYVEALGVMLGHADRQQPIHDYCLGAADADRAQERRADGGGDGPGSSRREASIELLHFVGNTPWSDAAMLAKVGELVLPAIERFLRNTPDRKLSPEIRRLKRLVERAAERNSG
jgi:SRSO17 transposase